jgi:hypothetical protein
MKFKISSLIAVLVFFAFANTAFAGEDEGIVDIVEKGCAADIEQYCSQVTKGEGRLLACFFAHEDKISGQCQYALYTASAQLEQAVAALSYAATECEQDILAHCGDVYVGEGRVLECLESKGEAVSESCRAAMNDVFE